MERERERVRVKTTTAFIHFNNITFCTTRTSITALEMVSVLYTRARVNQSFGGGGESLEDSPRNSVNLDSIASRYSVGVIDRSTESVGETDRTSMRETKDGSFFIFSGFFALTDALYVHRHLLLPPLPSDRLFLLLLLLLLLLLPLADLLLLERQSSPSSSSSFSTRFRR